MELGPLGSGATRFAEWYPKLYYICREDLAKRGALVSDVLPVG